MSPARIPFLRPTMPSVEEIAAAWSEIAATHTYSNSGPQERALKADLEQRLGASVSVVASGTAGLMLAARATFGSAGRALVPAFTFAAAPLALRWCGLEPVLMDADPETWQTSLADARRALARGPVAGILLANTLGVGGAAIAEWENLAGEHGVPLVIDSAAGFGGCYPDGSPLGTRGTCEVFSLHATKPFAVGEGGLVVSRDEVLIARLDRMKNFGFDAAREVSELGLNAKLDELSSAIGRRALVGLDGRIARRRELLHRYRGTLSNHGMRFQPGGERSSVPFVSVLARAGDDRDALLAALDRAGVEARSYYNPPIHRHPSFAGCERASSLQVCDELCASVLSLPMSDTLAESDVDTIGAALIGALL